MMYRIKVDGHGYFEGLRLGGQLLPTGVPFLDADAVRLAEVSFGDAWTTKHRADANEMVDALRSMGCRGVVEGFEVEAREKGTE